MRNRIVGGIGVIWGGSLLFYNLTQDAPLGQGAYAAGQAVGMILGGLLVVIGLYYLVRGGTPRKAV